MSAWLVPNTHIDALVLGCVQFGVIQPGMDGCSILGQHLIHENLRSLHARYRDELPDLEDVEYTFTPHEVPLDPRGLRIAIRCWMYQTSEYRECDAQLGWLTLEQLSNTLLDIAGLGDHDGQATRDWENSWHSDDAHQRNLAWGVENVTDLALERVTTDG